MNTSHFMKLAMQKAYEALLKDEVPVGALLVHKNKIISFHHNQMKQNLSCIDHAEILCIQEGIKILQSPYLDECDLYVSLEPCPMCASALKQARIRNIYFGAYDPKGGGIVHGPCLFDFHNPHTQYYGGYLEQEACDLLSNFFKSKR